MNIALIDDEPVCREQLDGICRAFCDERQIAAEIRAFPSGKEFLAAQDGGAPWELVFMDIFMDEGSGLETAAYLRRTDPHTRIVFVTSSPDYMPEAFSIHAYEYVLKPYAEERIRRILDETFQTAELLARNIVLPHKLGDVRLAPEEIVSVVSNAHYLDITLTDRSVLHVRMTVPEFLRLTQNDTRFLPVNRGILVNADHIVDMGESSCVLDNGASYPIQVRGRRRITEQLWRYQFEKLRAAR